MKRLILGVALAMAGITGFAGAAYADGCYLCGSGSTNSCQQCRYGAKDTGDARKACQAKGCKISGTGSCSTAANIKVCKLEPKPDVAPVVSWCE